jgi:hypothetical protein
MIMDNAFTAGLNNSIFEWKQNITFTTLPTSPFSKIDFICETQISKTK